MEIIRSLFEKILDLIYPIKCVNCKKEGNWLCQDCLERTKFLDKINCPYCKKPALDGFTHQACLKKGRIERTLCVIPFRFPWREVIHTLKFKRGLGTRKLIEDLLLLWRAERDIRIPKDFIVISVPLHWKRRFFREYNQAEIVAETIAKTFELKVSPVSVFRNTDTRPQSSLPNEDKKRNIKGVFKVKKKDKNFIEGRKFLVVDDVITSGATILETCRTLKRAGAAEVWAFGLARA